MLQDLKKATASDYHLIALVATLLFFGWYGYYFNIGDQEEHLPQVYKMFNPQLYAHDYFMVPNAQTFSIRFFYKWFVFLFSQLWPVSITCFILNFLCIYITALSVSKIANYFYDGLLTAFIAPVALLVFFPDYALGDNSFQDNALICSTISVTLCTVALLQYFRGNFILMMILTGIAAWFQVLESLITLVLITGMILVHAKLPYISIARLLILYFITAAPMLVPMISKHLVDRTAVENELYFKAMYKVRNPNHYIPSFFPAMEYLKFGIFMFTGLFCAWRLPLRNKYFIYLITGFVITGMLVYYVFLEKMNLLVIGKTQWFKSSIWLTLFYSVSISAAVSLLLKPLAQRKMVLSLIKWGSAIVIICIPLLMLNSKYIPVKRFRISFFIGNYEKSDLTLMHEWIEQNTPVDAVMLTSPNDDSFLCEAKRSLLIGYKAVIHEPYFMVPWAENFQRIYNFNVNSIGNRSPLGVATENYTSFHYKSVLNEKLDYRIDNVTQCKYLDELGPVVHRQGDYILTKVIRTEELKGEI